MTKELLEKANTLWDDIRIISKILEDTNNGKWVRVITPSRNEANHSLRFQRELAKWLMVKKEEYERELEHL